MWGSTATKKPFRWLVVVGAVSALALASCGGDDSSSSSNGEFSKVVKPPKLSVASPPDKATDVLTSTELQFTSQGQVKDVKVVDAQGQPVAGGFTGSDGKWLPSQQLAYGATYTVTAKATRKGKTSETKSTFSTMSEPTKVFGADINVEQDETVGVGLPLVVEFVEPVADEKRAEVERRLFISANPSTEGSWHWFSDSQVRWRPKEHWKPGTKVDFRLAIGGMDLGNGYYGKRDRVGQFTIGSEIISTIDNSSKTMTVTQDGVELRSFPISLGKPKFPTSSGTHVVIEKRRNITMDSSTYGLPVDSPDGYRTEVEFAVRYTWQGEFVHSAPWSVADQGVTNVSHGCVNAAPENASWYFELAQKGDLVTISGTEVDVDAGNGWGDWNIPWEEYKKGSALYAG
ncbi:MAG: L,D-transpeptidase family protein [Corynebacteriales bacterium]|nr:L,D-transpeptidase family protein [Mycobacteriales bacterium]